jgi:hypothetical protein
MQPVYERTQCGRLSVRLCGLIPQLLAFTQELIASTPEPHPSMLISSETTAKDS